MPDLKNFFKSVFVVESDEPKSIFPKRTNGICQLLPEESFKIEDIMETR